MEETYERLAELFKALGDPIRLKILEFLVEQGNACVIDIVKKMNRPQPTISHHLNVLKSLKIIKAQKEGTYNYYYIADEKIKELIKMLLCENNQSAITSN